MHARKHGRRWAVVTAAAVLALGVVLVVLRGGEHDGPQLGALRADPLARYAPPGATLVRTDAAAERGGGFLRKPTPATYRRLFTVPSGAAPAALDAATAAAREAGWTVAEGIPGVGVTGTKRLPSGTATMSVSLVAEPPSGVPAPALSIALEHGR